MQQARAVGGGAGLDARSRQRSRRIEVVASRPLPFITQLKSEGYLIPDSGQGNPTNVNSRFKKYMYSRYKISSYYDNNAQDKNSNTLELTNSLKYDPVRIVYNTLVGLNAGAEFCIPSNL